MKYHGPILGGALLTGLLAFAGILFNTYQLHSLDSSLQSGRGELIIDVKEDTVTTHTTTFTCCGLTHTTTTTGSTEDHAEALRKDIETFCNCDEATMNELLKAVAPR